MIDFTPLLRLKTKNVFMLSTKKLLEKHQAVICYRRAKLK